MALLLTLRPVAEIVQPDHAERASHAHQCSEINATTFQPERTIKAPMDQFPVHSDGMSEAERDRAGCEKQSER